MSKNSESVPDETDLDYDVIAVSQVIVMQAAKKLWRITSTKFDAYYTECHQMAELAERVKREGSSVKVGIVKDSFGRRTLHSMIEQNQKVEIAI